MSASEAKSWLRDKANLIPAIDIYHRQALDALHNDTTPLSDLADIIALDPGMSISLYNQINRRLGTSKHETIHGALALLGEEAINDLITSHKTLEDFESCPELRQSYLQLASQGFHLMTQLVRLIEMQGMQAFKEIRSAAILHNVGELAACLFDFEHYRDYQNSIDSTSSHAAAAKSSFGFNFNDLGNLLAEQWRLPDLVGESLHKGANIGRNARLIQLAANISQQAELGWNHGSMKSAIELAASFLNQPPALLEIEIKSAAVESARQCVIADVFPAAARLILLPEVDTRPGSEKTLQAGPVRPTHPNLQDRIKTLLQSLSASQSGIINLLTDGLFDDLNFSRVVMVLISKDESGLTTRLSRGLSESSPFHQLKIELSNCGLFESLMNKPQALWVNSANYKKFDALLPEVFKAASCCDNFFLMSLFVGNKSIGFVYCDRSSKSNNLDNTVYSEFKSCALLTSKALTSIARRDTDLQQPLAQ